MVQIIYFSLNKKAYLLHISLKNLFLNFKKLDFFYIKRLDTLSS